jgi:hypothetical protein
MDVNGGTNTEANSVSNMDVNGGTDAMAHSISNMDAKSIPVTGAGAGPISASSQHVIPDVDLNILIRFVDLKFD